MGIGCWRYWVWVGLQLTAADGLLPLSGPLAFYFRFESFLHPISTRVSAIGLRLGLGLGLRLST